jgi:hypothetical protein
MTTQDDKQQLLQNTQALMLKVAEASTKALDFANKALEADVGQVTGSEPLAETVRLGTAALKEGVQGAIVATDLSQQCIEIAEALEDMYGEPEEEKDGSD